MPPFGASSSNFKISQPDQFGQGNPVSNSRDPNEGPKVFSFQFDFTALATNVVDLTSELQAGRISGVQTCYIDNSSNNQTVVIEIGGTGQRISVAPGRQQYFAVLASNPCVLSFTSSNSIASSVYVALLNVPMPFASWAPNETDSNGGQAQNFGPITATTAPFVLSGGTYAADYYATAWNGASLTLQRLGTDGATYVPVSGAYIANGADILLLPPATYRWAITVAVPTALYVELAIVPGAS